jgi:hypothetical protein
MTALIRSWNVDIETRHSNNEKHEGQLVWFLSAFDILTVSTVRVNSERETYVYVNSSPPTGILLVQGNVPMPQSIRCEQHDHAMTKKNLTWYWYAMY